MKKLIRALLTNPREEVNDAMCDERSFTVIVRHSA